MNALTTYTTTAGTPATIEKDLFVSFLEWIDRSPKTTRTYTTNLKQFFCWLKYAEVEQPTRSDILLYREWLQTEHNAITLDQDSPAGWRFRTDSTGQPVKVICKPNTVAQYLRSVRQFFKWTATEGLYPDIAANVHAPKIHADQHHRKEALKPAEVLAIESSIKETAMERATTAADQAKDTAGRIQRTDEQGKRLYSIFLLAVNAGLRTVEISRANVKDFEQKGEQAYLWIWGKGHTEADQRKPLAPEVAEAIRDYLDSRTDHYTAQSPLFVSTGNRSGGKRMATTTISTMLKKAMKEAGFDSERLTAHSLRHTAGDSVMEVTGNNLFDAQMYMRHADPKTTERYLHRDTEKTDTAIAQKVYDLYHGRTDEGTPRERLESIMDRLTPDKLEKLAEIAAAML